MAKKKLDVSHIAKLARLSFTPSEEEKLEKELSKILNYVEKISAIPVGYLEPTAQVMGLEDIFRHDEAKTTRILDQNRSLSNAKDKERGFFKIQKLL